MSEQPPTLYTIGEVAAMLGVSPHTIRAWERRRGIVHPARTPSRQRRYRGEDVELLRSVKRAMDVEGMSLRVAYQTATGAVQTEAAAPKHRRPHPPDYLLLPEDASLWHAVSDVLPELILIVDAGGSIVDSNIAVARTFGGVRQRFAGRGFAELVDPNDRTKAAMLFEPVLRTTSSWELNMATRHGPTLYSFRTWQVRQGARTLMAVVGTEMYHAASQALVPVEQAPSPVEALEASRRLPSGRALDRLIDRLPFGVAVATVGPTPRVVYSNRRLIQSLGLPDHALTGRSLDELLPVPAVLAAVQEVIKTREPRRLTGVSIHRHRTVLDVALRPLLSSHLRVTSVLVVVEDATAAGVADERLEHILTDDRLRNATTPNELIDAGLDDLGALVPGTEFIIQLIRPANAGGTRSVMGSARSWRLGRDRAATRTVTRVLDRVATTRAEVSISAKFAGAGFRVTAVPVLAETESAKKAHLATVAWRRRPGEPVQPEERRAIDWFLAHFGLAAQLLRLRAVAARNAAFLDSASAAAAIVRESGDVGPGLAARFLDRLATAVRADAVVLGRIEGSDFVLQATGGASAARERPGQRFPLGDRFVAQAVKTGEPIATAKLDSLTGLTGRAKAVVSSMGHGVAVPLVLDRAVVGVIVLFRRASVPFSDEDVSVVQTLSSVAMLAIGLRSSGGQSASPTRATRARSSSRRQQSKTRPVQDSARKRAGPDPTTASFTAVARPGS